MPQLEVKLRVEKALRRLARRLQSPRILLGATCVAVGVAIASILGLSTWRVAGRAGEPGVRVSGFQWVHGTLAVLMADLATPGAASRPDVQAWASATLAHWPNATARARFLAAVAQHAGTLDEVTAQLAADRALSVLSGEMGPEAGLPWATRALWAAERFTEVPGAWSVDAVAPGGDMATAIASALVAGHGELVPGLWARLPEAARGEAWMQECRRAWEAGWGGEGGRRALPTLLEWSRQRVEDEDGARRARLVILAARALGEVPMAEAALRSLMRAKQDRILDHVACWRTLEVAGRRDEARNLAAASGTVAASTSASAEVVAAWARLGMPELSMEFLLRFPDTARSSFPLAATITRSLVEGGRWTDLRLWASAVRGRDGFRESSAYADFLEYVALNGMAADEGRGSAEARRELAEQRFRRVIDGMPRDALVAEDVACTFELLGFGAFGARARDLSRKMDPGTVEEWRRLAHTARAAGMEDLMLRASLRLCELAGEEPMHRRYALEALAGVGRVREGMPVRLLERSAGGDAGGETGVLEELHRAVALAVAGRKGEARALARGMAVEGLGRRERTWWNVAMIESSAGGAEEAGWMKGWARAVEPGWLGKSRRAWLAALLANRPESGTRPDSPTSR